MFARWATARSRSSRKRSTRFKPRSPPPQPRGRTATAVVRPEPLSLWNFPTWISPAMGPLSTAGLVVILVIFMLLEREQLREKLIEVVGARRPATTIQALDEAGRRVSHQLLMQTLVNLIYGGAVAGGLYLMEVPYPLLFGATGAALRYIPYLGPFVAAGLPIVVSLAALPGWEGPLGSPVSSWRWSSSRTWCSRRCSMRTRRACRTWRCSWPWPSGRGSGDRSDCCCRSRSRSVSSS